MDGMNVIGGDRLPPDLMTPRLALPKREPKPWPISAIGAIIVVLLAVWVLAVVGIGGMTTLLHPVVGALTEISTGP
jgi:hypothetical protein